eukprot:s154_g87.t1
MFAFRWTTTTTRLTCAMKKGSNKLRPQNKDEGKNGVQVTQAKGLEEWQEVVNGQKRCLPCNKALDEQHLSTESHKTKLERWKQASEMEAEGYRAPELPYLAWVPYEGTRALMCLLCRKSGRPNGTWVSDASAHCGTHLEPAGSKEHRKNLANYPPGDPWYEENVTRARRAFHPEATEPVEEQNARPAAEQPTRVEHPVGSIPAEISEIASTASTEATVQEPDERKGPKKRNKLDKEYRIEEESTDFPESPERRAQGPAAWLESKELSEATAPKLPPGWASAQDGEGNTYYYHRKERIPQWEFPEPDEFSTTG